MEVRLFGYRNPTGRCRDCPPIDGSQPQSCCDAFDTTNCSDELLCDSYFIYCLRPLGPVIDLTYRRGGCSNFESRMSTVNTDDKPIDFSQRKVLGLDNPLLLPGFNDTYSVSNYNCHSFYQYAAISCHQTISHNPACMIKKRLINSCRESNST